MQFKANQHSGLSKEVNWITVQVGVSAPESEQLKGSRAFVSHRRCDRAALLLQDLRLSVHDM